MSESQAHVIGDSEASQERDVERELRAYLARQAALDGGVSEGLHLVVAVIAAFLCWRAVPHREVLLWLNAIVFAALGRFVYRRVASRTGDPTKIVSAIRRGVGALGLAWGAGVILVGPQLPPEGLAWITVLFAGLVAGGTSTLLADPRAFHILVITLLVPMAVAVGLNGNSQSHVEGITLVAMFGVVMAVFYRRSHKMLLDQLRVAKRLELTERAAGAARATAERLSQVMEAATDYVGMAGPDTRLRYLNPAGRKMLGIGLEEDISQVSFLDFTPPRLVDRTVNEHVPRMMREGSIAIESAFVKRDGREIPVSLVSIVHRAPDGSLESMSAIARDVTEQVAAREALRVGRDAAEQATAAKSAFLANTSHEIRTPLNGILGMVELLLDTELTPEQRRSAELIASSGETLLNTINDVLDLSKIEADQLDLEEISYDLHQLLHSSARLFAARASGAGIELVTDVRAEVPQLVVGDSHRLRQILSNLIGNALKFTSAGEVVLTVRAASTGLGTVSVHFSVRDTGIGIAAEHVARIFEPFKQVDTSTTRNYGGTGLGLSISTQLVKLMHGKLRVDSEVGAGSDFSFEIPMRLSKQRPSGAVPIQSVLDGLRVLVVDDHAVNRRVTVDMLRRASTDVEDADNATSALTALRSAVTAGRPFRLVVSDVQMPRRDGFDLAAAIRADESLRQTTVMLLSSAMRRGDSDRCRELGVAAFLQRPVSRVELLEAAASALGDPGALHRTSLVTRHTIQEARRSLRILLVEDNPVNQEVASAMLRRRGHEVVIVDDGRGAVDAVDNRGVFDVILMDIQMPTLDGLEATRLIRVGHPTEPTIVALTADTSNEERTRCLLAGMNGYLTKPFKSHVLFAAVEGWSVASDATLVSSSAHAAVGAKALPVDLPAFRETLAAAGIEMIGDKMLQVFLGDAQGRMASLTESVDSGDAFIASQAAHGFKSGAANVRATELTRLLDSMETLGGLGEIDQVRGLLPQVQMEYDRVNDFLLAELGQETAPVP